MSATDPSISAPEASATTVTTVQVSAMRIRAVIA